MVLIHLSWNWIDNSMRSRSSVMVSLRWQLKPENDQASAINNPRDIVKPAGLKDDVNIMHSLERNNYYY